MELGDKIRIKNSCTKYEQKYNGETGIITKIYWKEYGLCAGAYVYISLDNQHNKNSAYGYFYFAAGDFDVIADINITLNHLGYQQKLLKLTTECNDFMLDSNIENIIDHIGEEKMRSKKIIDLWRDNQRAVILNSMNTKEGEILNSDPLYSSVKKHVDEIDKILSEQGFDKISDDIQFNGYTLNTTDALLSQNKADEAKLQKDLDKQYNEICTMLSACDTYEQEMEVLKTYKIVGEDGKLVVACGE